MCKACHRRSTAPEIAMDFHKFMQNTKGHAPSSYKIDRIEVGDPRFRGGKTYDEKILKSYVKAEGETRTQWK